MLFPSETIRVAVIKSRKDYSKIYLFDLNIESVSVRLSDNGPVRFKSKVKFQNFKRNFLNIYE